jgi:Icc-related predicted phosphoesterase
MQIMAVSDRILNRLYNGDVGKRYPDIDLLIGCGDLPFYYLDFLISALNTTLVYVRGNHDAGPQYTSDGLVLTGVRGGWDIHGRVIEYKELFIGGLEGSMRYRPHAPYMYTNNEMIWNILQLVPRLLWNKGIHGRSLDILVAHSPPLNIHDDKDLAHRGFKVFRAFMKRFTPQYLLHGHVHVYRNDIPRVTQFHETTVVNVYPFRVFDYCTLRDDSQAPA